MSEDIILSGSEENLKPVIALLVGIQQLLENRDIGQFVGEPLVEAVKAMPFSLRLNLILHNKKEAPYIMPAAQKLKTVRFTVSDVQRNKVNFQSLIDACGGRNGYKWGNWLATCDLNNGRQQQAYGSSKKEAEAQLERLLSLTTAKPLIFRVTELQRKGRRAKGEGMEMESVQVYPAYAVLINQRRITNTERKILQQEKRLKTRSKLRGDFVEFGTERLKLYLDKPQEDWGRIVGNALNFREDDDL